MASSQSSKNRVIVIDDNPAIHEDFRKILVTDESDSELRKAEAAFLGEEYAENSEEDLYIDLDSAMQGEEGYEKVQESIKQNRPYALAFVDMRMPPGWDGLTTIEKLWESDPDLQVVICSAYSDNTWSDIRRRLGRSDRLLILKKPFDNSEVLQMAAALIEKRRLTDLAAMNRAELGKILSDSLKQLSDAQSDSERMLIASESILIKIDSSGVIQRWNTSAETAFGVSKSDAIGNRINELQIKWEDEGCATRFFDPDSMLAEPAIQSRFQNKHGGEKEIQLKRHQHFRGELMDDLFISGSLINADAKAENQLLDREQV